MNRIPKGNRVLLTIFYILSFLLGIGLRLTVSYINTGKRIEWNGGVYHGQLVDGIPEGEGVFKRNGVTYEGTWTKGTYFTGKVTSYKYVYEGEVMNFKFHGYGACKYVDGRRYWGYWKEDMKHGLGRYLDSSGKISFGQFCNGLLKASNNHNFTVGQSVCGIDVSHHQGIINWQDLYLMPIIMDLLRFIKGHHQLICSQFSSLLQNRQKVQPYKMTDLNRTIQKPENAVSYLGLIISFQ